MKDRGTEDVTKQQTLLMSLFTRFIWLRNKIASLLRPCISVTTRGMSESKFAVDSSSEPLTSCKINLQNRFKLAEGGMMNEN